MSHWYKIHIRICPICGSYRKTRVRHTGPKPSYAECHVETDEYDYCQEMSRGYLLPLIDRSRIKLYHRGLL